MTNKSVELKAHKRIWLQQEGETTWCQDKINDDDIEYVLATPPQSPEAKMGRHDIVMFTGELVYRMMNPDTKMNVPTIVYEQVEIELDRHLAVCETDKEEDKNG